MPFAPGTFGTSAALIMMVFLKPSLPLHVGLAVFSTAVGIIASDRAEEFFGKKDPGCVVIDEFAGYIVSLLFLPFKWDYIIGAFILFRLFDIIKPPPLKKLQEMKGGIGVMVDDIGAAVYTNLALQLWTLLSKIT